MSLKIPIGHIMAQPRTVYIHAVRIKDDNKNVFVDGFANGNANAYEAIAVSIDWFEKACISWLRGRGYTVEND